MILWCCFGKALALPICATESTFRICWRHNFFWPVVCRLLRCDYHFTRLICTHHQYPGQLTLHAACQMLDCIPIFGDGHQSIYIPILMIRIMRWMTISHTAFFWPWNVWSHLRSLLLHCWSATNQVDTGRNPSMVIAGSMLIRWMGTQDIQSERYFRLVNSWETIKSRWRCTSAWVLGPGRWVWLWGWAHVTHMYIMLMVNETLGFNVKSCWI